MNRFVAYIDKVSAYLVAMAILDALNKTPPFIIIISPHFAVNKVLHFVGALRQAWHKTTGIKHNVYTFYTNF